MQSMKMCPFFVKGSESHVEKHESLSIFFLNVANGSHGSQHHFKYVYFSASQLVSVSLGWPTMVPSMLAFLYCFAQIGLEWKNNFSL